MEDLENLANTHLVSGGRNADWLDAINCATTMLISAKWATESPFVCFLCVIRYVRTRVKKGFFTLAMNVPMRFITCSH